ncbi:MAG: ABC transporter ATP-binding protein [bacterium]
MSYSIEVKDLTKKFGDFEAVNNISFNVAKGEIFGFLGPNGAGKSTTIRMLCGILEPTSGTGKVAGYDVLTQSEDIKKNIGYMSQKFSLYDDLTVLENLQLYAGIYQTPVKERKKRIGEMLEVANLRGEDDVLVGILPAGIKQRLALACSIVHKPKVLFLDEPTAGVDPISRRKFWDLIYSMSKSGTTILVTTHYMDEAEYCFNLALISAGEIIALGSPAHLKNTMMQGEILEIRADPLMKAIDVLKKGPGIMEVAVYGDTLHCVVDSIQQRERSIKDALADKGIKLSSIAKIDPRLEDVFVSLVERK